MTGHTAPAWLSCSFTASRNAQAVARRHCLVCFTYTFSRECIKTGPRDSVFSTLPRPTASLSDSCPPPRAHRSLYSASSIHHLAGCGLWPFLGPHGVAKLTRYRAVLSVPMASTLPAAVIADHCVAGRRRTRAFARRMCIKPPTGRDRAGGVHRRAVGCGSPRAIGLGLGSIAPVEKKLGGGVIE